MNDLQDAPPVWNNPHVKSSRLQRAVGNAFWAFAITLVAASMWGFWRALSVPPQVIQKATAVQQRLNQLERALVQMERSLLGLAHADSRKARFIGYDSAQLYAELRHATHEADAAVREILATFSGASELGFQKHLLRLELEWLQTRSSLADYLASGKPEQVSLSTLRTFRFQGQDTLAEAVQDFKRASLTQLEQETRAARSELVGSAAGMGMGFAIVAVLVWWRWVRPVRWLQRAAAQPDVPLVPPAPLRGTELEAIYQKLVFQERRLRAVEVFMRDLAMGRTPEPIPPTGPADALARSSEWLQKRFEALRAEQRKAV
ncbi:MAG: hypothetical protein ACK4UU_05650 [Fimbriimonadales bacterium]